MKANKEDFADTAVQYRTSSHFALLRDHHSAFEEGQWKSLEISALHRSTIAIMPARTPCLESSSNTLLGDSGIESTEWTTERNLLNSQVRNSDSDCLSLPPGPLMTTHFHCKGVSVHSLQRKINAVLQRHDTELCYRFCPVQQSVSPIEM